MAEGILKHIDPGLEVYSAGTHPEEKVHPLAIKVMGEIGIDISRNTPKDVINFLNLDFDYVITVCDSAREECPVFSGSVRRRLHFSFEDPARFSGDYLSSLQKFREVRDEIKRRIIEFYNSEISKG